MPVQCTCSHCGRSFPVKPYRIRQDAVAKFCSVTCKHASGKAVFACEHCGASLTLKASVAKRHRFCGRACYYQAMIQHGQARVDRKSPEYLSWASIKRRCLNPAFDDYHRYGGRGITICERWRDSFENFLADVGRQPSPAHTIDRIDNDGHYEPNNVRWSTPREQASNRHTNRMLAFNGETHCLSEWARIAGLSYSTLKQRLKNGWPPEKALTAPVSKSLNSKWTSPHHQT